jgi:hypothetical protein
MNRTIAFLYPLTAKVFSILNRNAGWIIQIGFSPPIETKDGVLCDDSLFEEIRDQRNVKTFN